MDPEESAAVRVSEVGGTLVVTISRADRSNALSAEVVGGLHAALMSIHSGVRCVLLNSEGERTFSAGADLSSLDDGGRAIMAMDLFGIFDRIERLDVPVVAAVQGHALGGGFELALCADLVLASEQAVFGLPETGLGLAPGIAMVRLQQHVGAHVAKELAMTGRRLSAAEAHALGLVNSVVQSDRLEREALDLCALLGQRSAEALRTVKRAFNRTLASDWTYVREAMSGSLRSPDVAEGLDAYRQGRPPTFDLPTSDGA